MIYLCTFAATGISLDHNHRICGNFLQNLGLRRKYRQRIEMNEIVEFVFLIDGIRLVRIDVKLFTGLCIGRVDRSKCL